MLFNLLQAAVWLALLGAIVFGRFFGKKGAAPVRDAAEGGALGLGATGDANQADDMQARFYIDPQAKGLFAFRLDASDDLRHWRPVGGEEQLVRLKQGGQAIERMAVDLDGLRWSHPWQTAKPTGVGIDSALQVEPVAPVVWSHPIEAERCANDYCDYVLPRRWPAQSLRIELAQTNTLAPIDISALADAAAEPPVCTSRNPLCALRHLQSPMVRRSVAPDETPMFATVAYRLAMAVGEARSPVLAIDGAVHGRLRLRKAGPVSTRGPTPPTLAVGAVPRVLVFLAQGGVPFSLTSGTAGGSGASVERLAGAPVALSILIPGYVAGTPAAMGDASVSLPPRTANNTRAADVLVEKPNSRRWWLYGA